MKGQFLAPQRWLVHNVITKMIWYHELGKLKTRDFFLLPVHTETYFQFYLTSHIYVFFYIAELQDFKVILFQFSYNSSSIPDAEGYPTEKFYVMHEREAVCSSYQRMQSPERTLAHAMSWFTFPTTCPVLQEPPCTVQSDLWIPLVTWSNMQHCLHLTGMLNWLIHYTVIFNLA